MPVKQHGRRQFLVGTGAVLSIPFLASLAPAGAKAQAVDSRFFIAYLTMHGGVWPENMWPSDQMLNQTHDLYSDHAIRYGRLSGGSSFSPVLTSSSLPQSLVDKMMLIRGLDIPFYIAHNNGGMLGNYESRVDGNSELVPTIDQVLANSSGFYGSGDPYVMRSMHVGDELSWVERSAGVQAVDPAASPDVLFRTVLSGTQSSSPTDPPSTGLSRTHVLNRVVEHYNGLANGAFGDARRLSANDKARLTDHMDMVSDLASRLDENYGAKAFAPACDTQSANSGNTTTSMRDAVPYSNLSEWYGDYNAVFAAGVACGSSRIAAVRVKNTFHPSSSYWQDSQWHEPVAHRSDWSRETWAAQGNAPELPQDSLVKGKNNFYRDVFVDMIERLDAIDIGDGMSLLDRGLVMWTQECGPITHHSDSNPIITAGSVDGYFNTGHYFDLRNRAESKLPRGAGADQPGLHADRRPGILYNQWLSNILQSMGMSPASFQRSHSEGWAGYGHAKNTNTEQYPSRLASDANKKIPKVTSGT